ncbi:MAG: site-specific DNA-methyltransferase [Bacteroidaceae bacterium]|nr:site-specific DNA-methyltransferase [Bacteroidaceae bacterium]
MDTGTPATRNRTITLTDTERSELRPQLLDTERLKAGHPWEDTIIWGDALDALSILPDACAHLIIADPPYNITRRYGSTPFRALNRQAYKAFLQSWLPALCRKLRKDGSLYLCGDWHNSAQLQEVLEQELTILNRITWQREKGRGAQRNWKNSMEDIWFAVKDTRDYHFNLNAVKTRRIVRAPYRENGLPKDWQQQPDGTMVRETCPSNFWDDISIPFWSMPENTPHPTQKPEKLIAKLILASSREGDLVLDPFMGSGTTAVVAKKLGRRFCCIEREEEYCLMAAKRLRIADCDKSIQGYTNGIFWERNSLPLQRKKKP